MHHQPQPRSNSPARNFDFWFSFWFRLWLAYFVYFKSGLKLNSAGKWTLRARFENPWPIDPNIKTHGVVEEMKPSLISHLCRCLSWAPTPCMTCLLLCLASFSDSMCGINTSSKPKSKRLCLELSGRKKNAPKHKVMKALRMRRRMNFSESRRVALWWGNEEVPGERVGILRPDSGNRAGVVIFWWWTGIWQDKCQGCFCVSHTIISLR